MRLLRAKPCPLPALRPALSPDAAPGLPRSAPLRPARLDAAPLHRNGAKQEVGTDGRTDASLRSLLARHAFTLRINYNEEKLQESEDSAAFSCFRGCSAEPPGFCGAQSWRGVVGQPPGGAHTSALRGA